jgi:hypothetical protein
VRDHVNRLYALVDNRAPREVVAYLEREGIDYDLYRWSDDFAEAYNVAYSRLDCAWGLHLDSDEVLEGGKHLRALAAEGEKAGIDAYVSPLRHWRDLAMTRPYEAAHVDGATVVRLRRRAVQFEGRVHSRPRAGTVLRTNGSLTVHHFNTALKSHEDFVAAHQYYSRLAAIESHGMPGGTRTAG